MALICCTTVTCFVCLYCLSALWMREERYFIPLYVSTYIGVTNKNLEP